MPVDGDTNPDSIELVARYTRAGKTLTALLTGDAEREETGACLAAGDVGDIDLLKVGHHGSQDSLTPDEAHALRPEVAVASAGEGNSYGHPDPTCVETLRKAGARFYCTKDVGDVEVTPGIEGPAVRVAHDTS
jgi:competence protein ComEC